nr:WD40 repeat domain-containing protein [Nostoc sp. CreGUA01]
MSGQLDIKQTVKETGIAATSAAGDAIITITNYYYREQPKTTCLESVDENILCPYRGLFHFGPEDTQFFFGRDVFVAKLFTATQTRNFIPVLGASGSGKSSVVFAGLVPQLQKQGHWKFTHFRPGSDPFHALSLALIPLYAPDLDVTDRIAHARKLASYFRDGTVPVSDIFAQIQQNHPNYRVLLIADQFEELYTLCGDEAIRRSFLDTLLTSFQTPTNKSPPATVLVATMRADFLGNALSYRPFVDMLQNADIKLGSMNREELSQVIEKPAVKLGVNFEAGLVARILNDVEHEPGNLPLLEFALTLLWERRTGKQLTHAAYQAIGEVKGALASHADENYQHISPEQREQVRRIFIQLVHPGEGTQDTRRLATKAELGEAKWSLVKQLADLRLVVTSRNATNQETVEVVHEALIQNWSELRQWMTADRHFRAWQDRLRAAIHQWEEANQDDGALLRGVPLVEAESWLHKRKEELSQGEEGFIQRSLALRDREKKERERRRRLIMSGLIGFSGVALSLAGFAAWQWQRSEIAQLNTLIQSSNNLFASNQQLEAVTTSIKAGKLLKWIFWIEDETKLEVIDLLQRALYQIREQNRLEGHTDTIYSVTFSSDGQKLASASGDKTIKLWDLTSGKLINTLTGHTNTVHRVTFSPDGQKLASASADKTIKLWDVASGQLINTLSGHHDWVYSVKFSFDGHLLASTSNDKTIKLWDVASNKLIKTLVGHNDWVNNVVFSPDGQKLASASADKTIKLWDISSGKPFKTLTGHSNWVKGLSLHPDGLFLASASRDKTVKLWNIATGQHIKTMTGHTDEVYSVSFSPNGQMLASASDDKTIKIWEVNSTKEIYTITGDRNFIWSVSFSPDGQMLASGGGDESIKLWDVATNKPIKILNGHSNPVFNVIFSPDGEILASGSQDNTIKLWDIASGKLLKTLIGHRDSVFSISFSPDGQKLASATTSDKIIQLWDISSGKPIKTLTGHHDVVRSAIFSPD